MKDKEECTPKHGRTEYGDANRCQIFIFWTFHTWLVVIGPDS